VRFLIFALIGYCIYLMFKGRAKAVEAPKPVGEETYKDPVCGTYVSEADAVIGRVEGERVHFCSMDCLEKYKEKLEHKG